jgi:hypothetical protein
MRKNLFWIVIFLAVMLGFGCQEPWEDPDKIFTVNFEANGGDMTRSGLSYKDTIASDGKTIRLYYTKTDSRGRLENLPGVTKVDDVFLGWFTYGGTKITDKHVFKFDTDIIAKWKNDLSSVNDDDNEIADKINSFKEGDLDDGDEKTLNISPEEDVDEDGNKIANKPIMLKPQILDFNKKKVTITIKGLSSSNIPIIQLAGAGAIFTVQDGVTLILENLSIFGIARNSSSLIQINSGGKVIINGNTTIRDNACEANFFGGGITVSFGGELEMNGNTLIKMNSTFNPWYPGREHSGGGVLVNGGKFIMNGGSIEENDAWCGGGVAVLRGGYFEMRGGRLLKNYGLLGGAGFALEHKIEKGERIFPTIVLKGGEIIENESSVGGAFLVHSEGILIIDGNVKIRKNSASDGGAIYVMDNAVLEFRKGEIIENKAFTTGGGIYNSGLFSMLTADCIISDNSSYVGGGIINMYPGVAVMFNGKIDRNTAENLGGGIVNNSFFYMHGGEVLRNTCTSGAGGGLLNGNLDFSEYGDFIITGGTIYGKNSTDNKGDDIGNKDWGAGGMGGAIYIMGGRVVFARGGTYKKNSSGKFELKTALLPIYNPNDPNFNPRRCELSIGEPYVDTDEMGNDTILMDDTSARMKTTNKEIEVIKINDKENEVIIGGVNYGVDLSGTPWVE